MKARARIEEVLRYLGYSGQALEPDLLNRIRDISASVEASVSARRTWRSFGLLTTDDGKRRLSGSTMRLEGDDIQNYLERASSAVLFACTLGSPAEIVLKRAALRGTFEQLVADATLSALVEDASDLAHREIAEWASRLGLGVSDRFSPGYGDFPLDLQGALIDSLDASKALGISVNDQGVMVPCKTVTAVIGVFESIDRPTPPSCSNCRCASFCTLKSRGIVCYKRTSPVSPGLSGDTDL